MFKPHLACDWNENPSFPCVIMPKVDGVRLLNQHGDAFGRSLKPHANTFTTSRYSREEFHGFDGELAADDVRHPDLCRITSSAVSTVKGEPFTIWWLFDYLTEETVSWSYEQRLYKLKERYEEICAQAQNAGLFQGYGVALVPWLVVYNMEQLLAAEDNWLEQGCEGLIGRALEAPHKNGRATAKQGTFWRIKRFIEEEAVVISLEEAQANNNEAQVNELGRTFRTTHAENKEGKGMIGALICRVLKDIKDSKGVILFCEGAEIRVGPGAMSHPERVRYWEDQHEIIGAVIKFKFFPKGIKDKPRFPTYVTIRAQSDIGG